MENIHEKWQAFQDAFGAALGALVTGFGKNLVYKNQRRYLKSTS